MSRIAMLVGAAAALAVSVSGHGFLIVPPSRNSIDKNLPMFAEGKFPTDPAGDPGCTTHTGACGCWCTNATAGDKLSDCAPGQSCYWFSQGCTIGCKTCTGVNARAQTDQCGSGAKATVCDPRLRTYNMGAECNSAADTYKHNPWRAPGTAPVYDPCGAAGGGHRGPGMGAGAGFFTNTTNNKEGDLGSVVLPPAPSGTVYKAGGTYDMVWGMRANHGGGYQYRLCPKGAPLTEACMQNHPLPFAGTQQLLFANGTRKNISTIYTYGDGTVALGGSPTRPGAWTRNPIPDNRQAGSSSKLPTEFAPPCVSDTTGLGGAENNGDMCSGERPFLLSIVDQVIVPTTTPPGEYVLGFRWDCEETAQIWSTCADITVSV